MWYGYYSDYRISVWICNDGKTKRKKTKKIIFDVDNNWNNIYDKCMINTKSYCGDCSGDYSVDSNNKNGGKKVGKKWYCDNYSRNNNGKNGNDQSV